MWKLFLLVGALLYLTVIVSKNIVHVYNVSSLLVSVVWHMGSSQFTYALTHLQL